MSILRINILFKRKIITAFAAVILFSLISLPRGVPICTAVAFASSARIAGGGIGVRLGVSRNTEREGGTDAIDAILEEFMSLVPDDFPKSISELGEGLSIGSVIEYIKDALVAGASGVLSFFGMLIGIAVLMSLSEHIGGAAPTVKSAVGAVLITPAALGLIPLLMRVGEGIREGNAFFSEIIPIMSALSAAGGLTSTAAAESVGMSFTLGIASSFVDGFMLPLLSVLTALSLISALDADSAVSALCSSVKGFFTFFAGLITTVIISVFALQSVVTTAADGMTMRAVKYAISGMVPVVGSTVSASISFLSSGAAYAAKFIGVSSVLVIVSLFGSLLIELFLFRLAFSLAISVCELTGASSGKRILGSVRSALDALISLFVSVALIYVAEIVVFIACAGAAYK